MKGFGEVAVSGALVSLDLKSGDDELPAAVTIGVEMGTSAKC